MVSRGHEHLLELHRGCSSLPSITLWTSGIQSVFSAVLSRTWKFYSSILVRSCLSSSRYQLALEACFVPSLLIELLWTAVSSNGLERHGADTCGSLLRSGLVRRSVPFVILRE